jgi:hypothetical protein
MLPELQCIVCSSLLKRDSALLSYPRDFAGLAF